MSRKFTQYAIDSVKADLEMLIDDGVSVSDYQNAMIRLGVALGEVLPEHKNAPILLVSTSEDADYLTKGCMMALEQRDIPFKLAVFWNHHYQINDVSVAPITQKYLQDGWRNCQSVVLLKSIISGSCVVRTNLLALLSELNEKELTQIIIAAPVMFIKGEAKLREDFPDEISEKFEFVTFALDSEREPNGVVIPGIGGEVYGHLGLEDQPAKLPSGYMPDVVSRLVFA